MVNLGIFIFTVLVDVAATLYGFKATDLIQYFHIPSDPGTLLMRPWTLITNIFFHAGFSHIFKDVVGFAKLKGASGGVTAVIVASGVFLPRYEVSLFFGRFRVELRWIALFLVFRDLLAIPDGENIGGLLAHLGGAIFGALYILNLQGRINIPTINLDRFKLKRSKKVVYDERDISKNRTTKSIKPNQEAIDAILDKISQSGYDSLTKTEKEILFKASE